MTVRELKEKLKNLPDHMDVFIRQVNDEYGNSQVELAEVRELVFSEDSGPPTATDKCFVLTDEI